MIGLLFWLCVAVILYAYIGYPVLLALVARLRPPVRYAASEPPLVTLLIAAYNEEEAIAGKLKNTLALDYPREALQVIVAADGSDDRTAEIVRSFEASGIELSYLPQRAGKMAAINRAVKLARGEILVFSDANNMYETQTLRELVKPFVDAQIGGVIGSKRIVETAADLSHSEGVYWRYEAFIRKQETRLGSTVAANGEIMAVRQKLYIPPPDRAINDDFFILMEIIRQGFRVVYTADARSHETVSATAQDEMIRRARIVAGRYQAIFMSGRYMSLRQPLIIWQVISHKFMRPLIPFAMIGALLFNLAALLFPPTSGGLLTLQAPFAALLLVLQAVFYAAAWLGAQSIVTGKVRKLLYVPTFLVRSNAAALWGLYQYLHNKQGHLWQRVNRSQNPASSEAAK